MDARRLVAPLVTGLLVLAVGGGIWYSNTRLGQDREADAVALDTQRKQVSIRGLIGSEKESFFADERVRQALAAQGITVTVEKAGSRSIAGRYDASRYDFGFPSGAPAAQALKESARAANVYTPFYTPIVFASWRPIADILIANGIARREGDFIFVVDLPALMALVDTGKRWRDLKNSEAFATGKAVLVNSTDVRTSNSAAMYLALASYLANQQQIVQSQDDVRGLPGAWHGQGPAAGGLRVADDRVLAASPRPLEQQHGAALSAPDGVLQARAGAVHPGGRAAGCGPRHRPDAA